MIRRTTISACALLTMTHSPTAFAQHSADMWIGASGGRLAWSTRGFVPGSMYSSLGRVDAGPLFGWSDNDPGFDHATAADATVGVAPLLNGAQVWLEVVKLDPALMLIDDAFHFLEFPGQRTFVGNYLLHEHFTWYVEEENPLFDPERCTWSGTFVLRDLGNTGYQPSLPFTMDFTIVPVRAPNGSFDMDQHVDLEDAIAFAACMFGPTVMPQPDDPDITTCEMECFNGFDFDNDRDIDLKDFMQVQRRFTD